jgi:hypothetical protein
VHGAVSAHGHDAAGTRAHGSRRELDAVAGTIGALGFHGPALYPEFAHDRI